MHCQTYSRWYMFGLFFFSSKLWFHFEFMCVYVTWCCDQNECMAYGHNWRK
jgi:hypothetical protein